MSNTILTDSVITKEALRILKNELVFTKNANKQYSDRFAVQGAKKGATIDIRKPPRYVVNDGPVLVQQDTTETSIPLTLDQHKHVGMGFSQVDLTLSIDKFGKQFIEPAVKTLAGYIDYAFYAAMYKKVYSAVGVPSASTLPSTLKGFNQGVAKMALLGSPVDDLTAIVDPRVQASMVEGLSGYFSSQKELNKQYEKGRMGEAAGCVFKMSQSVVKHTAGAIVGTPLIDTTVTANGTATVHIDGITGSITGCYKQGDVLTFADVYAVNPQTRESTGELAQFVVTADTDSVGGEIASLPISPAMYASGAFQNITAFPVDGAAVELFGHATSYASVVAPQNMIYHPDAFALGCADIELPKGMDMAARASDKDSGLSIALIRGFDIVNYRTITRLDSLFGYTELYPQLACRVVGQHA